MNQRNLRWGSNLNSRAQLRKISVQPLHLLCIQIPWDLFTLNNLISTRLFTNFRSTLRKREKKYILGRFNRFLNWMQAWKTAQNNGDFGLCACFKMLKNSDLGLSKGCLRLALNCSARVSGYYTYFVNQNKVIKIKLLLTFRFTLRFFPWFLSSNSLPHNRSCVFCFFLPWSGDRNTNSAYSGTRNNSRILTSYKSATCLVMFPKGSSGIVLTPQLFLYGWLSKRSLNWMFLYEAYFVSLHHVFSMRWAVCALVSGSAKFRLRLTARWL